MDEDGGSPRHQGEIPREQRATLESEIKKLQGQVGSLERDLADAQEARSAGSADEAGSPLNPASLVRGVNEARLSRERSLEQHIHRLEIDSWELRHKLEVSQWKLQFFVQRKWWRLGVAINAVRSNVLRIFTLPLELARIAFRPSNIPPSPEPREKPLPYREFWMPAMSTTGVPSTGSASNGAGETFTLARMERRAVEPSRDLLVATLLDEFSFDLFEHEFRAVQVTPGSWRDVLADGPALLLVESAWRGKDETWHHHVAGKDGPSDDFRSMVNAFRAAGVPTVFWNKEDPPNYHIFIEAAKLFDVVFTVCEESIPDYVNDLGHDRVYLLPFSVQPKVHNPIAVGERQNAVAFAGTYYAAKHPNRVTQVDAVLNPARDFRFVIFSRRATSTGNYKWPDQYGPYIVGSLPYTDILVTYKMFAVFLNVNSVVDSQSMCARRVFELAASGTPIVSGTSPAIERFFGNTVLQAKDSDAGRSALQSLLESEDMRSRIAVGGIRTVMRDHTASLRFDEILKRTGVTAPRTRRSPAVSIIIPTDRQDRIDGILENVARQTHSNLQLVVVARGFDLDEAALEKRSKNLGIDNIAVVHTGTVETHGGAIDAGLTVADGAYVGRFADVDVYGAEFVGDAMDAFVYTDAGIVGKQTHYSYVKSSDSLVLTSRGHEHTYVEHVASGTIVTERAVVEAVRKVPDVDGGDPLFQSKAKGLGVRTFSGDRYNYLQMRSAARGTGEDGDRDDAYPAAEDEVVRQGFDLDYVSV